jgi:hypothetical protein
VRSSTTCDTYQSEGIRRCGYRIRWTTLVTIKVDENFTIYFTSYCQHFVKISFKLNEICLIFSIFVDPLSWNSSERWSPAPLVIRFLGKQRSLYIRVHESGWFNNLLIRRDVSNPSAALCFLLSVEINIRTSLILEVGHFLHRKRLFQLNFHKTRPKKSVVSKKCLHWC